MTAALAAEAVLARYGWKTRPAGRWLRSQTCPACGGGESDAFAVCPGGFRCHRCSRRGDLLALVALFEDLDVRRDFERVLEVAAAIAGVPPRERVLSAEERAQLRWGRARQRQEAARQRAQEERERLERAVEIASDAWAGLRRRNRPGEAYLRERGLGELVGRDGLVRFDARGTIRVPLYTADGRICNVPGRYLPGRARNGRKILGVTGCPTRGSFGYPDDLLQLEGPVVVTEGIFDYLSACVIWPDRVVFGAHGASNLGHVAGLVAERIAGDAGRDLWLVPHHDDAGLRAARKAWRAAVDAGLPRSRLQAYDTRPGDLNDWLRRRSR